LSIRPVVMSLDSVVQVTLISRRLEAILSADGQQQTQLGTGDRVLIRRSRQVVRLLRPAGSSFFCDPPRQVRLERRQPLTSGGFLRHCGLDTKQGRPPRLSGATGPETRPGTINGR